MSLMQNRVDTKRMRFLPSQVTWIQWAFWWRQFLKRKGSQAACRNCAWIIAKGCQKLARQDEAGLTTPSEDCYSTFLGCSLGERRSDPQRHVMIKYMSCLQQLSGLWVNREISHDKPNIEAIKPHNFTAVIKWYEKTKGTEAKASFFRRFVENK